MKRITINDLSPYLPYNIMVNYLDCLEDNEYLTAYLTGLQKHDGVETTYKRKINGVNGDLIPWRGHNSVKKLEVKPILRPLSDIDNIITHNGESFRPLEVLNNVTSKEYLFGTYLTLDISFNGYSLFSSYQHVQKLLEWHFDIWDLCKRGLAIKRDRNKFDYLS